MYFCHPKQFLCRHIFCRPLRCHRLKIHTLCQTFNVTNLHAAAKRRGGAVSKLFPKNGGRIARNFTKFLERHSERSSDPVVAESVDQYLCQNGTILTNILTSRFNSYALRVHVPSRYRVICHLKLNQCYRSIARIRHTFTPFCVVLFGLNTLAGLRCRPSVLIVLLIEITDQRYGIHIWRR